MSKESLSPPQADSADHLHVLARIGIPSIPMVGGPGVELFNLLVTPSLQKRLVEWMESVAEGLKRLEDAHGDIMDDLKSDDEFIDTVIQASQTAACNSHQEKKDALRNAVLNSALSQRPDESRRSMFVGWIESFTPWHLRMLKLFANPLHWYQENGRQPPQYVISSSLSRLLTDAYPELQNERELYDKVAKDLYNNGLIRVDGLHTMMSERGAFEMRATPLGDEFLRFIADPTD